MIFPHDSVWRARRPVIALLAFAAAAGVVGCDALRLDRPIRVATGVTSHVLCSETFVAGLDPDAVYAETVRPTPGIGLVNWALHYDVDRARREVRTTVAGGFESRAIYRDGLGCLVVRGAEPDDPPLPVEATRPRPDVPPLLPAIAGPRVVEPADVQLRAALDRAFAEPAEPLYRQTKAIVVVHDGRIVAERYAPGYGIDTPILGWSATKTFINALIGILVRDGKLSVYAPAPVAAWSAPDDPRHAITIDELLRHTSGLALDETDSGFDPSTRIQFLERDTAGFAESAGLQDTPGKTWNYTDGNYVILSHIVRDAVGGHAADVVRFLRRELYEPLGIGAATLEFDAVGTPMGATYMLASARDWTRLGMLYLADGVVGGKRILPEGWVNYASTPTLDSNYGAGLWTNRGTSEAVQEYVRLGMPPDSFFVNGVYGQYVVVVPAAHLVVARFGVTQDWPNFDVAGVARLVAAVVAAVGEKSSPGDTSGHDETSRH
jgi:CubicO group peptidase (beta-lactamase class C family)